MTPLPKRKYAKARQGKRRAHLSSRSYRGYRLSAMSQPETAASCLQNLRHL